MASSNESRMSLAAVELRLGVLRKNETLVYRETNWSVDRLEKLRDILSKNALAKIKVTIVTDFSNVFAL